ncbi:MAG: helix-turn-helix domain-containing protein [Pseudomonadota bacterium]
MGSKSRDPHIYPNYLRILVDPPYLKTPKPVINPLGLPVKPYYTTQDLCKVLNIVPDTLRYRFKAGYYPEPGKVGNKRRFAEKDIRDIIKITEKLIQKRLLLAGKKDKGP